MSDHSTRSSEQCLSRGVMMALVDEQLEGREKAEASLHLQRCPQCQQAAKELRTVAEAVKTQVYCLDDEDIACYVDHRLRRTSRAVTQAELDKMRGHLKRCARCREAVEITAAACQTRTSVLDWARRLIGRDGATARPLRRSVARWAGVAALAVAVAAVVLYLAVARWSPRHGPGAAETPVAEAPESGQPVNEAAAGPAPRGASGGSGTEQLPTPRQTTQQQSGGADGAGVGRERTPAATGEQLVTPRIPPAPETALVPREEDADAAAARALAALAQARTAGDAKEQAKAALRLAGIYHKQGQHALAADRYREAAAAAERSGEAELRVDAVILLGSALAELHERGDARRQFDLALNLSRKIGYQKGERNALVQLRLLDSEAAAAKQSAPAAR